MLLLLLAAASAANEPGRVGRVVKLLNELKSNLERDAATEEKIYNKYACWCDNTASAKASGIDQAKADIRTLSSEILALRGERAATANDISTTATSIDGNEASTHELTLIRQKTSADAGQEISKMQQTVGALETAIRLVKAGYSLSSATSKLHKVDKALSSVVAQKVREATNHSLVVSFLEEDGKNLVQANAKYSPMSEKLLGVLQSLYGTFSANLWSAEERESTSRSTFQTVLEEKSAELALLTQTVKEKDEVEAEKAQIQAVKEQQLLDFQDQIVADDAFFKATVKACTDESNAYDERKSLQAEEAAGIDKALGILMSDENRDLFNRARASRKSKLSGDRLNDIVGGATRGERLAEARPVFVQLKLSSTSAARVDPHLQRLKLARHADSALVQAHRGDGEEEELNVTAAMQDAAKPVVDEIDKMVEELKAEELLDIENRDWCINETGHYKYQKVEVLEYEINVLTGKIERIEHRINRRDADIESIIEKNATLIKEMEDALSIRADENAAYLTARDDDVKAVEVLNSTIDALNEFYENNDLEMDTIPDAAGAPVTVLQGGKQPEFEISADQAPETVATNTSYGGHSQATKAIVDLLQHLVEDTEWEIEKADDAEDASLNDYNTYVNRSKDTLASWLQTKTNLEVANAADLVTKGEHEDLKATTEDMHTSVVNYLLRIKPNCDWINQAFEMRLQKREQEMRGLADAKAQLLGASADGVGALLAAKTKVATASTDASIDIDTASTDQILNSLDDDQQKWAQRARVAELVARHKMFLTKVAPKKSHGAPKPGVQVDETGPEQASASATTPASAASKRPWQRGPASESPTVSDASRAAADEEVAAAMLKMKKNGGLRLRGLS
jgi:hypothetical protein